MPASDYVKVCCRCKVAKPRGDFNRDSARGDGLRQACRECQRSRQKELRDKDPERHRAYQRRWYRKNEVRMRERARKWRKANPEHALKLGREAKQRVRAGRISPEYNQLLRGDPCAYCGGRSAEIQIDHIDASAAGGSNDWLNLTAACGYCNRSKDQLSLLRFLWRRTICPG